MRYLNTEEAAHWLRLSRRYLEGLRLKGGGPHFITYGRAVRYSVADLEAWAESRKRRSTSDQGKAA